MTVEERANYMVNKRHLNKAATARSLNMNPDSFYRVIQGKRKITANELIAFCDEINLTVDEFMKESEVKR